MDHHDFSDRSARDHAAMFELFAAAYVFNERHGHTPAARAAATEMERAFAYGKIDSTQRHSILRDIRDQLLEWERKGALSA